MLKNMLENITTEKHDISKNSKKKKKQRKTDPPPSIQRVWMILVKFDTKASHCTNQDSTLMQKRGIDPTYGKIDLVLRF